MKDICVTCLGIMIGFFWCAMLVVLCIAGMVFASRGFTLEVQ